MRARLIVTLLYPFALIAGQMPSAHATVGRWCGAGPVPVGPTLPMRDDPHPFACHALITCERERALVRKACRR